MTACRDISAVRGATASEKVQARQWGVVETVIKISNCLLVFFLQGYVYFWASSQHTWSSLSPAAFCRCLVSPCLMELKALLWGALHRPIPVRSAVIHKVG